MKEAADRRMPHGIIAVRCEGAVGFSESVEGPGRFDVIEAESR
jgi:hypothetical protein